MLVPYHSGNALGARKTLCQEHRSTNFIEYTFLGDAVSPPVPPRVRITKSVIRAQYEAQSIASAFTPVPATAAAEASTSAPMQISPAAETPAFTAVPPRFSFDFRSWLSEPATPYIATDAEMEAMAEEASWEAEAEEARRADVEARFATEHGEQSPNFVPRMYDEGLGM